MKPKTLYTGRKPKLVLPQTLQKRLAKVNDSFTFFQFCNANDLTKAAGRNSIMAAKKYRYIKALPAEKFEKVIYLKTLI
jgi:hypothetical protein